MHVGMPSGGQVLRRAVVGQRRIVAASSFFGASHQAGEAMVPVLIGVIIDRAVATGALGELILWIVVLAAVFVVLSFSCRFAIRTAERACEQAAHEIRIQLTRRVLDPRGGAETGRLSGALVNIATEDAKRVGTVNRGLPMGIAALTALLVSAVALLNVSIPLGLLVLLGTPPLLLLAHLLGKPLERRTEVEQERAGHASGTATDLVIGLRVLKGIGAEAAAVARYRRTSQDSLVATLRAVRAHAWHDGTIFALTGIFIAVVALVGGRLAAQGDISIGGLVAAVGLAQFLLAPLMMFAWVNSEFAQARASATRVAALLAAPTAVTSGTGRLTGSVRGRIRLRGVSHAALRGVDLGIEPGEMVGIVAADPAVATALLECLGRDADPAQGVVELDDVALSEVDPDDVRAAILVAAHDADLFEGSLIDNVTAATPGAAGSDGVRRALSAAAADEVAQSLPYGVDTVIAERGRSLSGGQRQRVALARALATDPPVLVVHDPTTAVDAVTEARIAAEIREIRRGRTTIMVTTSPALLAVTDRVVALDSGVTVEGKHAHLVNEHEGYRAAVLS